MRERAIEAVKILKTEYGIANIIELEKAIKELGAIDISPFCSLPVNDKKEIGKR